MEKTKERVRKEITKDEDVVLLEVISSRAMDVEKEKENCRRANPKERKVVVRKDLAKPKETRRERMILLKDAGFVVIQDIGQRNAPIVDE